jgi:basic membrane protein A
MKKSLLVSVSILSLAASLVSCGNTASSAAYVEGTEIALVTDVGNIDDHSFNEACWKGCKDYSAASKVGTTYYRPAEDSTAARVTTINNAIAKGAKVIVMPGYLFNEAVATVAPLNPNVRFLGMDVQPLDYSDSFPATMTNTTSIIYKEQEAGFFAGYAAVKEGYTKIGFVGGMAVPAVVRYGQGYVLGANYAATEDNMADGSIECKYWYSGTFTAGKTIVDKASGWYTAGTQAIFSCGGGIYASVVKAASDANDTAGNTDKKVIGVDVDQHNDSPLIITSAMKNLESDTLSYLTSLYNNKMEWGTIDGVATAAKVATRGVATNSVGLPTDSASWLFKKFTVAQYNAVYAKVKAGDVKVEVSSVETEHVAVTKVNVDYQAA